MTRAKISELKDRLSFYLRKVRRGEEIEILDRNNPIARIIPIRPASKADEDAWLERLRRSGVVRVGSGAIVEEILRKPPAGKKPVGALQALLEERRRGR